MIRSVGTLGLLVVALASCGSDGSSKPSANDGGSGGASHAGGSSGHGGSTQGSSGSNASGGASNGGAASADAACKVAELYVGACTCAIKQDGSLWCFGYDSCLGISTTDQRTSLREVKVPGGVATLDVSDGGLVLAINRAGDVYYWGDDEPQPVTLARSAGGPKEGPIALPGAPKNVRLVSIGNQDTLCMVTGDNDVSCMLDDQWKPFKLGTGEKLVDLSVSNHVPCALDASGKAYCWDIADMTCTAQVEVDVGEKVTSLDRDCLLTESGAAYCDLALRERMRCAGAPPVLVPDVAATTFSDYNSNTCYLDATGAAFCKGAGERNGSGANFDTTSFVGVDLWAGKAKTLGVGWSTCAVLENDRLWCWGTLLPTPGPAAALSPVMIPLCAADKMPEPPEATLLESFEDVTGTPAPAVSGGMFSDDCQAQPVGTVMYSAGSVDLDYAVCGPTGVLERDGSITGFYGGQHYVGLFSYVDPTYPVPEGQQKSYGAVFFNDRGSFDQSNCMSNDFALGGGRSSTMINIGDTVCGTSTLISRSPFKMRLNFTKRKYAEIELKPVPGTAEIPQPMP